MGKEEQGQILIDFYVPKRSLRGEKLKLRVLITCLGDGNWARGVGGQA